MKLMNKILLARSHRFIRSLLKSDIKRGLTLLAFSASSCRSPYILSILKTQWVVKYMIATADKISEAFPGTVKKYQR